MSEPSDHQVRAEQSLEEKVESPKRLIRHAEQPSPDTSRSKTNVMSATDDEEAPADMIWIESPSKATFKDPNLDEFFWKRPSASIEPLDFKGRLWRGLLVAEGEECAVAEGDIGGDLMDPIQQQLKHTQEMVDQLAVAFGTAKPGKDVEVEKGKKTDEEHAQGSAAPVENHFDEMDKLEKKIRDDLEFCATVFGTVKDVSWVNAP